MGKMKKILLTCLVGLIALSLVACGNSSNDDNAVVEDGPKIARVRLNADIKNLDPARRYTANDDYVSNTLFSGLITYSPNSYEIENDLAEEFEFSEDGSEIYFKLREGVQFNKGLGEVTAEDVKYSYERFLDPETASSYKDDWLQLDSVEVISKYEGRIILKGPFAPLMTTTLPLTSGSIVPKDYVEEVGLDKFTTDVVGSGPYYIEEWQPNQKVIVKRNPDYYGETPYWDEIHFIIITSEQSAELALKAGEIDFGEISAMSNEEFLADSKFEVTDNSDLDYRWIGFNVEHPKLQDVNVRNAIRYAISVPEIMAVAYDDQFEPANSMLAPGLTGYWADAPAYERDIEKAKELMKQAGVDSLDLRMDIVDEPEYRVWGEIAQENLKDINVNLEIVPLEYATYWEAGVGDKGKDIEMFSGAFQMKPDPSWATMWFTSDQIGVWNWMRWGNDRFDQLHVEGLATTDEEEREEIYIEMQKLMDEDAVALWITHGKTFYAYNPDKITPAMTPNNAIQFADFGPGK